MAIINLRRYYPHYPKDKFLEVPDEVAEALEEGRRIEHRQDNRRSYYHVYSMDCTPAIENHAMFLMLSPEELLIQGEDEAAAELLLANLAVAMTLLSPTQARRLHARYALKKKFREIAAVAPPHPSLARSQSCKSFSSKMAGCRRRLDRQVDKESLEAKKAHAEKEISQLENRQKILLNRIRKEERNARTSRLCRHGAMLEGVFPAVLDADGEAIKEFLIALSRLPGAGELAEKTLNAGDAG